MANEPRETDWFAVVLEVINPALVMGLVGSLAYFLLDVCYRGHFDDQLRWTLFFFVFAIVLVARISFTLGSDKAATYGLLVGGATFLATMRFVEGLGVVLNLVIILVIAGSSYLLTKDTTWMGKPDRKAERGLADALADPWQLISQFRSRHRPHGLWVVWFTLAALPIFAIGQSLIPVEDVARRQSAFWRMTVYIGCGLGLLLTTALVNLRQYLKARKMKLPTALAARWLATGAIMVVLAMLMAALLPRPQSETPLIAMMPWGSPERDANKVARDAKNAGRGDGKPGGEGEDKDGSREAGSDQGQPDDKAKTKSDRGEKGEGGKKGTDKGKGDGQKGDKGSGGTESRDANEASKPQSPQVVDSVMSFVQGVVRWLVILAVIVIVALVVLRFLANSREWAAAWWQKWMNLFGRKPFPEVEATAFVPPPPPPRAFTSYSNPFADGTADHRDGVELIRYSFAALEAWSREQGRTRDVADTPLEFAKTVGELDPDLLQPAARLAAVYSRLAYARRSKTGPEKEIARAVWDAMEVGQRVVAVRD